MPSLGPVYGISSIINIVRIITRVSLGLCLGVSVCSLLVIGIVECVCIGNCCFTGLFGPCFGNGIVISIITFILVIVNINHGALYILSIIISIISLFIGASLSINFARSAHIP